MKYPCSLEPGVLPWQIVVSFWSKHILKEIKQQYSSNRCLVKHSKNVHIVDKGVHCKF
jgi:hypothetical protein